MSFIKSRLRRLEECARDSGCLECAGVPGIVVAYDEATERKALYECCSRCGRALTVIRVVYDR
jgi:hypothetical protein